MTAEVVDRDYEDAAWLDGKCAEIRGRMGDIVEIVREIVAEWGAGRNLRRLFPGRRPSDVVIERVGETLPRELLAPLLALPISNVEIAKLTGVTEPTVRRELRRNDEVERPTETLGGDWKTRAYTPSIEILDPPRLEPGRIATPKSVVVIEPTDAEEREAEQLYRESILDWYEGFARMVADGSKNFDEPFRAEVRSAIEAGRRAVRAALKEKK